MLKAISTGPKTIKSGLAKQRSMPHLQQLTILDVSNAQPGCVRIDVATSHSTSLQRCRLRIPAVQHYRSVTREVAVASSVAAQTNAARRRRCVRRSRIQPRLGCRGPVLGKGYSEISHGERERVRVEAPGVEEGC